EPSSDSPGAIAPCPWATDNKLIPSTPQAIAAHTRGLIVSLRKIRLSTATVAGMADMITPADTALVMLTPNIMHSVNRKLPRNDSRKISHRVDTERTGSVAGLRIQRSMAMAPMPKRSQPSKKTGSTSASGLVSATYAPTSDMDKARQAYAFRRLEGGFIQYSKRP